MRLLRLPPCCAPPLLRLTSCPVHHCLQVMSSGMTSSTAHHSDAACEGSFREDLVGLRPLGSCAYMAQPNFALLEVDWQQGVVSLSVRREEGGEVAAGHDGSRQEVRFSLGDCSLIK
jgi:alkaline phosphatase D